MSSDYSTLYCFKNQLSVKKDQINQAHCLDFIFTAMNFIGITVDCQV